MQELYKALFELQGKVPKVIKNKDNPFFNSKYADLKGVIEKIVPLLQENQLAVFQRLSDLNGEPALTTTLWHKPSGEYVEATMPLILPKQDPQAQGSAITYARRYSIMTITGLIADDDDDGYSAGFDLQALAKKKQELYKAFMKIGTKSFAEQKAFINSVLGKETIDDQFEADRVIRALKD